MGRMLYFDIHGCGHLKLHQRGCGYFVKKNVFKYKLQSMSLCGMFIIHWHRPHGRDGTIVIYI